MTDKKNLSDVRPGAVLPVGGLSKEHGGYLATPLIKPTTLNEGFEPTPVVVVPPRMNTVPTKDSSSPKK